MRQVKFGADLLSQVRRCANARGLSMREWLADAAEAHGETARSVDPGAKRDGQCVAVDSELPAASIRGAAVLAIGLQGVDAAEDAYDIGVRMCSSLFGCGREEAERMFAARVESRRAELKERGII